MPDIVEWPFETLTDLPTLIDSEPAPAEIISNFVPDDPCLKSARFSPAYTVTDRDGICPINVVDGEATARNYFVRYAIQFGSLALYGLLALYFMKR